MRLRPIDFLTERERHVLVHLMEGLTPAEIAAVDFVALCTVRSQIRSVLMKLHVRTTLAAVAVAHREMWPNDAERHAAFHQAVAPQRRSA